MQGKTLKFTPFQMLTYWVGCVIFVMAALAEILMYFDWVSWFICVSAFGQNVWTVTRRYM